ncbi:MAG: bifunctional demethylmenaquinone methyltransferase/2-methoxy-6-polyprenyl-1,4-benzoquinol methylase UbiE [Parachlamydiaceae bacterium]
MNYQKSNASSIQLMFSSIAREYDRANAILSFNLHKLWNRQLVSLTSKKSRHVQVVLDLCAGTGEITKVWLHQAQSPLDVHLLDFCPEMLSLAKTKLFDSSESQHKFSFIQANAESIPLSNDLADAITVAYGVRNIHNIDQCFHESFRVLKSGGCLGILELTSPENRLLKRLHQFYLKAVLPRLGGIVTKNKQAYEYLCQSIQEFVTPCHIKDQLLRAGFSEVTIHPQWFGTATVIVAKK